MGKRVHGKRNMLQMQIDGIRGACRLLLAALALNAIAVHGQTSAISVSGLWKGVTVTPSCNYTQFYTFEVTYANGAYSATQIISNARDNACKNVGSVTCMRAGFFPSAQDLLTTSRYQAMVNTFFASCFNPAPVVQSASFASPDSISSTMVQFDGRPANAQWNRTTAATYALGVKNAGTGYGNVASNPAGISCYTPKPGVSYLVAPDCAQSYVNGTKVTLTATADTGSIFAGWSGDCTGRGTCTLSVDEAKEVFAVFSVVSVGASTCTLSANPASIRLGGSSVLKASCVPAATSYVWHGGNCADNTGATCVVSPPTTTTYAVTGSNAAGASSTARATVTPVVVQSTAANNTIKAVVSYNSADTNKSGSVFIFGYLPANSRLFGSATKSASAERNVPMAGTNLALAVLTASGWQQVLGGGSVPPVYNGTLNDSTSAFALYVQGLFDELQDAGIICVAYSASVGDLADEGVPVVVGKDPSVTCPSVTLAATPQAGVWWNPAEGGRGFVIEGRGNTLFLGAFLYDVSGRSTWYAASGAMNGDTFDSTLTTYANGQTFTGAYVPATATGSAGDVSITFTDASNGTLTWPGGTIPIQRFDVVTGGAAMTPPAGTPETGMWWDPAESGRGYALEIQNGTMFLGGYMYDASGNPLWYSSGPKAMTNATTYAGTWSQYGNGQTLTGTYKLATVVNGNVGPVTIRFSDTQNATLTLPDGRTIPITRFRF